jgi:hypothetical protein
LILDGREDQTPRHFLSQLEQQQSIHNCRDKEAQDVGNKPNDHPVRLRWITQLKSCFFNEVVGEEDHGNCYGRDSPTYQVRDDPHNARY